MSLLARDFLAPFRRRTAPEARAPLAEVEPAAGLTRVSGRGPRNRLATRLQRRRRVPIVGAAESLEQRLALAVVTPFDVRFSANDTGDITFAANTIMTAPGDSPRAQLARAGIPDPILGDQILNNDFWDMAYVDIDGDPTTFNSSAADLVLPVDAEVLFAGLYWGGRARGQTQFDNFGNVKFRGPDDGAYRNLSTTIISSTPQGAPSGARNYQSFIDVTNIVEAQGGGTYTTANVQAFAGAENYSAGWSLVVAFREPGAAARNLTVFDGFAFVTTSDSDVTINISGFQAPPAGPVTGTLGFIAYEGDLGITGDRAFFNGGLGEQQLSNATNPANNFFNSSISDLGLTVTTKNPNYVNQLGFGADLLAADGLIANSATAGTVRLTTTQDFYYPGVITSAIDLDAPKVSVLKGVTDLDGGDVIAGDTLRYTITVSNAASALDAAVGVLLNDALPANTTFVPGSLVITAGANSGGKTDAADFDQGEYLAIEEAVRFQLGTGAGGALPVPVGGRLAPGESTTVSFDVTIDPDVLAGTIISNTSRASFTAETSRFELFATSNRVDVECRPSADLAITKTDGELTAIPGEALTYTIVVTNNGPDPVTGATVSDTFPAALLGAAWTVSYTGGGSGPAGGSGNIATAVNLPALATATFVVTATIDPLATGTLSNTATVLPPAGVTDRNLANNTATDTTILVPTADLAVVKTRTSGAPVAGAAVSYLITVTNNGPSTILGFTLTDTTAPVLIGATFGSPSMGSYNSGTGAWTGLMLATGQSVTITLSGTVPGEARGDLDNTAVVAPPPDVTDPNLDNNTSIVSDVLALVADLNVVKIRTSGQPVAGEAVTYQITVTNQGPTTIDSFGGVDVTTPALENPTYAVDVGSYDPGTGIWTGPALATGGVVVFTLTGTVPAGATGLLVNTATVSPPPGVTDPDPSDDSSTVTDEIDLVSDLAVVKTRTSGAPVAGAAVSYLITVTNNGPSTILGFTLTDTTAPGLIGATFGSPSMGSYNSGTGAWTGLMLATGQSVTITLSGTVPGEARGDLDNTAVVAPPPDVTDPNLDNNTSIVSDVLALVADLNVVKIRTSSQPVAGEAVTYQITVTNQGPTTIDSFGGVDVTTPALENPTYAVDVGSYDPGTGIWTGPALATGGVVVFTLTGTVPAGATGLLVNTATVSPPPGVTDPDPSDDSSTVTDEIDLVSDLAVVKTRTSGAPVAGSAVSYLITVTNNGPSTILGFTLTDTTAPVLIGATFGSPSMGSYNSGTGAWTGLMLATGQSVTITLSGTVPGEARGDLDNTAVVAPPPDVTDPNLDNNTSIVSDVLALVADLNVVKIRTSSQPVAGEAVTYQITVTNQGPTTIDSFGGVDVTTPALENPTYAVDVGTYDPGTGIWTGPALATGGVVVFTLTGTVPAGATGLLVNTATVSPPPGVTDPDPSDDSSTVTDEIDLVSDLAVVKTRTSGQPVAGSAVSYLITVTNNGPSTILGFTLTDTTAPVLIGATFGSPSMGSYNSGTGAWTGLMLATGQSVTITLSGTVPGEARGDLDNTAVVAPPPDVTDPNLDNNTSIVSDVLALVADLNVVKIRTSSQPVAGEAVTYQITVTNQGPTTIDSFGGVDVTTPALENPTYAVDVGSYDPGTGIWTGPALATGGVVVFTLTGTVPAAATGLLVNTATVSPPPGVTDPDPSDDSSTVTDEIDLVSDLAVVKTRTSGQPVAGAPVTYSIVVSNLGPSSLTSFTGTDMSTPMLEGIGFTVSTGTYDPLSGLWTADPGDEFATGETVIFTLNGTVPAGATGLLVNTATALPPVGVTDPNLDNNTSTVTDELGGVVDLTATKTGDVTYKGGGFLNYTMVITNLGPSFASGVRVVDLLPTGIISWSWSVSYTGVGSGTADGSPDTINDSTAGIDKLMNLAVLGTATFTISALTDALFQSDITNTVVATLGQESATATWTSAYDGPINPTEDVAALVVSNDDLCFGLPFVRVLDPDTGVIVSQFLAYEPSFRGSVRVATGDVNGDGVAEIVVAPGRNRIGQIRVFTPDGVELPQYRTLPFGPAYRGGVDVAVGDIDGDGDNDIIASRSSGLSRVSVFGVDPLAGDPVTNVPIRSFIGIPGAYRNGAVITAGDYGTFASGMMVSAVPDGIAEIAVGSNAGIRAQVRVFDASVAPRLVGSFVAIRPGFRGGVTLSSARWDGDTADDIIVGAGVGGRSIVEVYGGVAFSQLARLAAFSTFGRPNAAVNAAALDITGDGVADNLYGVQGRGGSGGTRGVRRFDRLTTATTTLPSSTELAPPLRIAPITLRILGG